MELSAIHTPCESQAEPAHKEVVDEAVSLGALWCLITGGEPLLRDDFSDIYLYLKKKGLLLSLFTNATLVTKEHVRLFKKYPPRDVEASVYGVSKGTYERVTRRLGGLPRWVERLHSRYINNNPINLLGKDRRYGKDETQSLEETQAGGVVSRKTGGSSTSIV